MRNQLREIGEPFCDETSLIKMTSNLNEVALMREAASKDMLNEMALIMMSQQGLISKHP